MSMGARINNADLEQNFAEQELINVTLAEVKNWAIAGAAKFSQPYKNSDTPLWQFDDFWKRSNTFHGYLRLVQVAERKWGATDPELKEMQALREAMIEANSTFFDTRIGGNEVWADDYGWCGISCLAARDYLVSVRDQKRAIDYLGRAIRCWKTMCDVGYDSTTAANPVPHGCANIDEADKKAGGGAKNSVTNSNLLVLSLRLYHAMKQTNNPAATECLKMAYSQFLWFKNWFRNDYVSRDDGYYLRQIEGHGGLMEGLLHERPMAKRDYIIDLRPPWQTGWVWTGDQGLILAALAELYLVRDELQQFIGDPVEFDSVVRQTFFSIARGVRHLFFDGVVDVGGKSVQGDSVLREAPFNSSFAEKHGADYVGGRGVLLRYVSEPAVTQMLGNKWFYPAGFAATAAAVWNSRDKQTNQFTPLWNKDKDAAFNKQFVDYWKSGNVNITEWKLDPLQKVDGPLQGAGLDAFTAAIVSL
jgi:hypothetical protein